MGDCQQTGKPFWYLTNTKVNSVFYPYGVGKSCTGPGRVHLCRVAGNTV